MSLIENISVADHVGTVSALGVLIGVVTGLAGILRKTYSVDERLKRQEDFNKIMCKSLFSVLDSINGSSSNEFIRRTKEELRLHLITTAESSCLSAAK